MSPIHLVVHRLCTCEYLEFACGSEDKRAKLQARFDSNSDGLPSGVQVDVLYLHNVEESQRGALGDRAFMDRLRAAFQWLEKARAAGRIQVLFLPHHRKRPAIVMQLPWAWCT